jgi:2-methylisocitrate lyase-like PEP mutase family enzyme
LERAGATAIQLEDQTLPKRCGHLDGKLLVSGAEMEGKIKAAVDARHSTDTLIVARTDAVAVEGLESAFERAARYVEAGADVLFVEALRSKADMSAALRQLGARAPMLANMVEGGKTPLLNAEELQRIGYRIVIFPGGTVRALAHSLQTYLQSLRAHGSTAPFLDRMLDFQSLNQLIGTAQMLEQGRRYDG